MSVFEKVKVCISMLNIEMVTEERKTILQPLVDYVQTKFENNQTVRLNFICTHNSRRSHLTQIWAQTMAYYFELKNVDCYSGGTEATALFPMVITTLQKQGFEVEMIAESKNPIYTIKYGESEPPIVGFSKKIEHSFNPVSGFCAVMTCSQADEGCPFVLGAENRVPITYEDPKAFDNTPQQAQKYEERSLQIATEMKYVFSKINVK